MTDRTTNLTVVLDGEYREDDIQCVMDAIGLIKGVVTVGLNVTNYSDYAAEERVKQEIRRKIYEVLK